MFLRNLLVGERVYVMYDSQVADDDEDGKYVASLYRAPDGLNVNLEAVRQGFAAVDPSYSFDDKATFLYYQRRARQLHKGIWGFGRSRSGGSGRPAPEVRANR
jgi:endonuclease YncB( thermonuclease family)